MMNIVSKRARFLFSIVFVFLAIPLYGQSSITGIRLTYKRDPRQVDATRGIGPWAEGPAYGGATAQDSVEVRAEGVNASGKALKISPQWIPSDPEMVTVAPSQGEDVKITVHRAGESKLTISFQRFSMELVVKAYVNNVNNLMVFEIAPAPAPKPAAHSAAAVVPGPSDKEISYAAGRNLAKALQEQSVEVDADSLVQGVKDTLSGGQGRMTEAEALAALQGLATDQRIVEEGLSRKALAEKNKREGEAFLAQNKSKDGVVTLPSGLQYRILKEGQGKKPTPSDLVDVHYRGTFIDGKEFANNFEKSIATMPVNSLVRGWAEALQLMPVGSRWQLFVPSELAYGERGAGGGGGKRAGGFRPQTIGPNTTLVFDLELVGIQEPGAQPKKSSAAAQSTEVSPELLDALKKVIQQNETKPENNQ